jgi:hypothetical protein
MVLTWLSGQGPAEIWRVNRPGANDESARLSGENYVQRIRRRFAWGYFGFLSIVEYARLIDDLEISPEVRLFYRYLQEGVDNPVALILSQFEELSLGRETAVSLSRHYPEAFTGTEDFEGVVEWLMGIGRAELEQWLGEDIGARIFTTLESLRNS